MSNITFSEQAIGTIDPIYITDGNIVTFDGLITTDSANPTSPVFAGSFDYLAPITVSFAEEVSELSFDTGYFDTIGATLFTFVGSGGDVLGQVLNSDFGIEHISFAADAGISGFFAHIVDDEPAGFAIDNLVFETGTDDTLNGGNKNDVLDGGGGEDVINAANGDDTLLGGSGDDVLNGGNGNDMLDGGTGKDDLQGGNGNDALAGEEGDDMLSGGNGADLLRGGADNDALNGGTGQDTLEGGEGDDTLTGGIGSDTFLFKPDFGHDLITDFRVTGPDHDVLEFDSSIFADAAALFAHSANTAEGVLVTTDAADMLLIRNSSVAQLQAHPEDFHFV